MQENFFNEEKNISMKQGFNICLFFFNKLWRSTEPKLAELDHEEAVVNELFFLSICSGLECSAEWNQAVFLVTGVPKREQRINNLQLSEKEVFLSIIEFSKIYDEVFHSKLKYVLNLLESMQSNPMGHSFEWSVWEKVVDHSFTTTSFVKLDWNDQLPGED